MEKTKKAFRAAVGLPQILDTTKTLSGASIPKHEERS